MKHLTVLVDMDDVLEDLLGAWVTTLNKQYGLSVQRNDIVDWDVSKFFPTLTKAQVFAPLYSDNFWRTVQPIEGAAEVLQRLIKEGHRVYVVTNSSHEALSTKMTDVLFRYFPFLNWDDVIITANKQMVRGDILVDDNPRNLLGGDYLKILFDCPHNRSYDAITNGMIRVHIWQDIYSVIQIYAQILEIL